MRAAREEPGSYGASYEGMGMVFETVGQEEDEDYYHIRLSYRPAGRYIGEPGVEEFLIDKTGKVEFRQVLDVPSPAGSQDESDDNVVAFPDKNLEAAVRNALQEPEGPLTRRDLKRLDELIADERGVKDLTGLEYVVNLTGLGLGLNQISDVSPLASLTNLTKLYLHGEENQINDITPLASLTNLTGLGLGGIPINIGPLTSLPNLTGMPMILEIPVSVIQSPTGLPEILIGIPISDISPLTSLTNLTTLYLVSNQINDFSPLTSLTNLTKLALGGIPISDISRLASLTNLITLDITGTGDKQKGDVSPLASLTNLTELGLNNNQISDVSPLASLTNLTNLGLSNNQISDVSPLASLTNLTILRLVNNPIKTNWLGRNAHVSALRARGVDVFL
jgi:internalin A